MPCVRNFLRQVKKMPVHTGVIDTQSKEVVLGKRLAAEPRVQ
jgi:hypothetical protein